MLLVRCGIHGLEEACLDIRTLAVADRLHEEITECTVLEEATEHVVHPPTKGGTRDFNFLKETRKDSAFARFRGTRFQQWQTSVCPMRWMRPKRCSSRLGFQGKS